MRAHLLSLCSSILGISTASKDPASDEDSPQSSNPDDDAAIAIVDDIFTTKESVSIRQWGLVCLARALGYSDAINGRYLEVLLSLNSDNRRFLLNLDQSSSVQKISLPSSTGMAFVIEPVVSRMNPLHLVRALESHVIREKLERLDLAMMQTLHGCVVAASQFCSESEKECPLRGPWVDVFNGLRDFILVGLCDPECATDSAGILSEYVKNSPLKESVISENKFLNTMRLVYPADDSDIDIMCQQSLENFFSEIFCFNDKTASAVVNTIEMFSKNFSANFENSNLGSLLKEFMTDRSRK